MAILSYALLFAAVTAALLRAGAWPVGLPAVASIAAALASGMAELQALLSLGLGGLLALTPALSGSSVSLRLCTLVGAGLFALGAVFRLLPGFPGLILVEPFGRDGLGILAWRYDKGFAGLLLVWLHQHYPVTGAVPHPFPRPTDSLRIARRLVTLLVGTLALLALAVAVDLGSIAPALVPGWWAWILGNTFLTVVSEEALFRGLIQGSLQRHFEVRQGWGRRGYAMSIGLTAAIFGLVHLPWGAPFALLAALAGVIYGLLYGRARSLGWAIAGHAVVNASVLLLLKSPFG